MEERSKMLSFGIGCMTGFWITCVVVLIAIVLSEDNNRLRW